MLVDRVVLCVGFGVWIEDEVARLISRNARLRAASHDEIRGCQLGHDSGLWISQRRGAVRETQGAERVQYGGSDTAGRGDPDR